MDHITIFNPLARTDELELLRSDDAQFSRTKGYLTPLIDQAMDKFKLEPTERTELRDQLLADVAIAARRFLDSPKSQAADYTFCTYFSWYIAQRINVKERQRI